MSDPTSTSRGRQHLNDVAEAAVENGGRIVLIGFEYNRDGTITPADRTDALLAAGAHIAQAAELDAEVHRLQAAGDPDVASPFYGGAGDIGSLLRAHQLLMRLPEAIAVYQPGETHLTTDELHARLADNHAVPYWHWEPATLLEAFEPVAPCPEHGWCRTAFEDALAEILAIAEDDDVA